MSEQKKMIRIDQAVVLGISCLVIGFTLGMIVYHLTFSAPPAAARTPMMTNAQMPPPAAIQPPGASFQRNAEEVREAKRFAEQNPKNRAAWVNLGNLYFDNDQAAESVAAYTKALQMDPNDPNVATDRGIMSRKLGDFAAAEADFRKSADMDPKHYQSLYHLGLLLLHDMRDAKGAKAAWERMLTRNPPQEVAAEMQQRLANLQSFLDKNPSGMPGK